MFIVRGAWVRTSMPVGRGDEVLTMYCMTDSVRVGESKGIMWGYGGIGSANWSGNLWI
jgi:hypothetical protein